MKKIWTPATTSVAREDRESLLAERADALRDPVADDHDAADEAREDDDTAREQAVLEPEAPLHPLEPRIAVAHEVEP